MDNSAAYHIGQIVGALLFIVLFLGIVTGFIIALVKAFTTRKKGWIIAASLFSLPFLLFIILVFVGFIIGFKKGLDRADEISQAKHGESSQLLTAAMTPVAGNFIPYEISLPWASEWQKNDDHAPFDYLFSYHDVYIGVIAEGIGVGTPQAICDISQKNLAKKASTFSFTKPASLQIDSQSWLTYDADANVSGIKIKYRFYVYADTNCTIQIITWTSTPLFDRFSPVFDRVAKSFKLPRSSQP
jgi:hypothetical protein